MDACALWQSKSLYSASEALAIEDSSIDQNGIYAFWFRSLPGVPMEDCVTHGEHRLVYVGLAAGQSIRSRLTKHFTQTASVSTVRFTLGCLLGMPFVSVGKGSIRLEDEAALTKWMAENARVSWIACDDPRAEEQGLLSSLSLPLNVQGNQVHPFCTSLKAKRSSARRSAAR